MDDPNPKSIKKEKRIGKWTERRAKIKHN